MRHPRFGFGLFTLVVFATTIAACTDLTEPGPDAPEAEVAGLLGPLLAPPALVECPADIAMATDGVIDGLGGVIGLAGHTVVAPALAVDSAGTFTVGVPASRYLEITINPKGGSGYQFNEAIAVTLDYSRCPADLLGDASISVWQIDPDTKLFVEQMGGVNDVVNRKVTFLTDHLSTFSIAH